jgi:hypothetical protein
MDCRFLEKCPFFLGTLKNMPETAEMWRKRYCHDKWVDCARYKVRNALGPGTVPDSLLPDMQDKVHTLLKPRK